MHDKHDKRLHGLLQFHSNLNFKYQNVCLTLFREVEHHKTKRNGPAKYK